MEKFKKILFILMLLLNSCERNNNLQFYKLLPSKFFNDNGKFERIDYFAIKNFKIDDKIHLSLVDCFVSKNIVENVAQYSFYQVIFYQFGGDIDENYKHDDKNLIEWQGDNMLLEYRWENGVFIGLIYYKGKKENASGYEKRNIDCKFLNNP